ncbi:MAG: efflux RND transporter permease subunit [Candidatus Eremiobacteraeota bacterium]|nr:efflux RND transporter permease subunit [Candidatus Eremiobacteraeota bacterium]MBC5828172.1 efflux RND transporter permease subunit [Candidatus Eremiobacteraeota bacterium]
MAAWALRNPYGVIATYAGLVLAAIAATLFLLPTRMMPYVQSPLISVITMTPGYSPREVETYFSKPIEERMTDLKSVRFIRSISQQGLSIVTLQFPYGADMQRALVDVQQLVQQAEGDLPYDRANLKPSYVIPVDPLNTPVLQLSVRGQGWDPVQLRQFVANEVVDQLKTVPGVQQALPFGGLQRQLQVIADRGALASDGLSLLDIRDALDRQNASSSGGTLTGGSRETIVRGDQRVQVAGDLLDYPVSTTEGKTVYLRDVATVKDAAAERRSAYRVNGQDGIELSIIEEPDASSPRVITAVNDRLAQIEHDHPGLHFTTAYDNSRFVTALTRNMFEELAVSVMLAGLVLLIFLEDVSATAIVMTSIPTCLGLALLLFGPMKFSINSSTLVGLLLAVGRLVDDSIVVIHAVHRQLQGGKTPAQAAVDGTMEVILPIAAATGVMILAVVPLLISGGITQIMFVGLVWPIVFALVASLVVSVTLTPLLAAYLFKGEGEPRAPWRSNLDDTVTRLLTPARRGLQRVEVGYSRGLGWSLQNRGLVLGIAVVATYVGMQLYPFIGSEMMPLADTGQGFAYFETAPGTSFSATSEKAHRFERILLDQPEVEKVSGEIGDAANGGYFTGQAMNGPNAASYLITFKPKEERRRTIWQVMDSVYARTTRTIPGLRRVALKEMGADVMASNAAPVELVITGPDLNVLQKLGRQVADVARGVPGLVQVSTSWSMQQPEQRIIVDRTRAAQLGLAPQDVQNQAYYALHGGLTTEFFNPQNVRHSTILVRYGQNDRATSNDLRQTQITGKNGQSVPLSSIANIERGLGPSLVEHDSLNRSVSVLGYYRKGSRGEMALDTDVMMQAMSQLNFPTGYAMTMRGDMTEMTQSFDRLLNAMKIALVFVFLLLLAQFRSFAQPLVMLLAIPLELLGVFGGLLLAHQSLSTVSILGIVVANGMAVSNAILLLDLIIRKRSEGLSRQAAIFAAGPVRLRPILMTTIVSLIVLVPVAFFPKTGIDAYSPLATVIIGGLTVSTLLTLFVIPVLHDTFGSVADWLNARRQHRAEPARA